MKLSVSLLSTYLYCPRKVFLQKVLRLKEPLKQPLVLGTIRHRAMERASLEEQELVSSIISDIDYHELYRRYSFHYASFLKETIEDHLDSLHALSLEPMEVYEHALSSLLMEAKTRAANTYSFHEKTGLVGKELWEGLTPKIISEMKIESEELQLVGIVDQVHDFGDYLIPVELKTGKIPRTGLWPSHRIQIAAYALMLQEHQKKPVREARVHYLDKGEKRELTINPFLKEEIMMLVREVQELISQTLLPGYCESHSKCTACGLRRECYNENLMQSLLTSARKTPEQQLQLV